MVTPQNVLVQTKYNMIQTMLRIKITFYIGTIFLQKLCLGNHFATLNAYFPNNVFNIAEVEHFFLQKSRR